MDFEPLNSEHAVQTVVFTLIFDRPFEPSTVEGLRSRKDLLADLPAVQLPETFALEMAAGSQLPVPRRLQGAQLSHLRPDGTPAWALRLVGNELAVECTRYTRWEKVWGTAHKYLQSGLDVAASEKAPRNLLIVGQTFVDAFVANQEDYDLGSLLKHSPRVAEMIFSAGPTWHNHVGWFEWTEAFGVRSPCLNQLNVDTARIPESAGRGQLRVNISHNQELRLQKPVLIEEGKAQISRLMDALHTNNKKLIKGLLTDKAAVRIGLEDQNVATSS